MPMRSVVMSPHSFLMFVMPNYANAFSFFLYLYLMAVKKRETKMHKGDRFLNSDFLLANHSHFLINILVDTYYMVVMEVMR